MQVLGRLSHKSMQDLHAERPGTAVTSGRVSHDSVYDNWRILHMAVRSNAIMVHRTYYLVKRTSLKLIESIFAHQRGGASLWTSSKDFAWPTRTPDIPKGMISFALPLIEGTSSMCNGFQRRGGKSWVVAAISGDASWRSSARPFEGQCEATPACSRHLSASQLTNSHLRGNGRVRGLGV